MMTRTQKILQPLIAIFLVAGLLAPAALEAGRPAAALQPALAQAIASAPDQQVRVIVQKAERSARAERLVESLGGVVLTDLHLINAFAAELPAQTITRLARDGSVRGVSLDAPVSFGTATTETVRDEFNTTSYNNNDGTAIWASSWIETGDDGAANGGNITVEVDDCPNPSSRCIEFDARAGLDDAIERQVDLSGALAATLTFDYRLDKTGAAFLLEVSADGGATWNGLHTFNAVETGAASFDLSPHLSPSTRLRWRLTDTNDSAHLYLDNVQVEYSAGASATVRDEFNNPSYQSNDGSLNWEGGWVEDDLAGPGPLLGNVAIAAGQLTLNDYPDTGTTPSAAREVDLSTGATSATLSFNFYTSEGVDSDDAIALEVSTDGGGSYKALEIFTGYNGSAQGSRSYDLTPYLAADTMIRFRVHNKYGGSNEHFAVDNVQIHIGMDNNTYRQTLGVDSFHAQGITGQGIGVAVIDSGIASHPDFAGRLVDTIEFGPGDAYGHGTHVAGIIGGSGAASGGVYAGIAPGATLVNLGISDENGMGYESDVVNALQWANDHKDLYNIRVVNLSLNSVVEDSYNASGIDAAVEILWLNNVVVVASAGNKGPAGGHNTARTAPANDPYGIAVGASHEHATSSRTDDTIAAFSSFGITVDGYSKPDLIAPGYDIYSALSPESNWDVEHPERLGFNSQYIRLSGTSMAAPMVSGAVALLLQDEPNLTPDQVKYRLLQTGSTLSNDEGTAYPYLDVTAAVQGTTTEASNQGNIPHELLAQMALIAYWSSQNGDGDIDWENVDWDAVNWESVNWNSVNWNSVNWNSVNWNSVNWNSVNWNSVNWNSVNWNSVNWNSVNWNSVNWNSVNWNSVKLDGIFWGPGKGNGKKK